MRSKEMLVFKRSPRRVFALGVVLFFALHLLFTLIILFTILPTNISPQETIEYASHHQLKVCTAPDVSIIKPNNETGFELTCPCNTPADLPQGIHEVKLFYHVGMMKNWKDIVKDQLTTISSCGLGHYASSLTISYTHGHPLQLYQLRNLLNTFPHFSENNIDAMSVTLIPGPKEAPWEGASISAIYDVCGAITNVEDKKVVVFYFHTKGVRHYDPSWRDSFDKPWSYSRGLYWRKYMEYFLLERPGLCLGAIANGASTCGVELNTKHFPNHYSGNFWSASCEHIANSTSEPNSKEYLSTEFWLLKNIAKDPKLMHRYIGLYAVDETLYRHLIVPSEYEIQDELEALEIISGIPKTTNDTNEWRKVLSSVTQA